MTPKERDPDNLPGPQAARTSIPDDLVHILTDVALAAASMEIVR